ERGLSLRALAAEVGLHFSHLSKIENGQDDASKDSLLKLSESLGLDADLLLGEAGHRAVPFRLAGNIAAGNPLEAIEDVETFDLGQAYDPHQHYLLRVRGTSMIDAGINDGDLAIIRSTSTAKNGDIVVAIVEGEDATLKTLRKSGSRIQLIPANESLSPMEYPASQVEIRGVCVGLVRTSLSFSR
ncbi:MAG: helix-turn-helix domain-containing protein, partial [Planctomycetaceae bacterium]|nr:helix-turn-helix domain-containing protein [Planctomycetaceae bacterium]